MIFPPFALERDIENCLTNDFNIGIYKALTENKGRKLLFEPLNFINLLYEQHLIIIANKAKPLSVVKHLLELPFNQEQQYYLLLHLVYLNDFILVNNCDDNRLKIVCDFIREEFLKLETELFPDDESECTKWNKSDSVPLKNYRRNDNESIGIAKLSLREIALICHYTNIRVNRKNGNEIAESFSLSSGDKLYNFYTYYQSLQNRIGDEGTPQKNSNKLKVFLKVFEYLKVHEFTTVKILEDISKIKSLIGST